MGAVALDTDAPWPALGVAGRAVIRRDDGRINQYPVSAGPSMVGQRIGGACAVMAFQT